MTRSGCVNGDTVPAARRAGPGPLFLAASLAIACVAHAAPRELRASVVWVRADLIYVAAPDSGELVAGMTLSIVRGRHELASAAITQLLEPRLAVARLGSGSIAREKRLDKLRVRGEAPVVMRAALLRVGVPGRGRTNLLFACGGAGVASRLGATAYAVDSSATGGYRLVRTPDPNDAPLAPDTLLVRFFSDAADQEIALERGELDVAVFWPGELSARMRADARWREAERGVRERGVLVAVESAAGAPGLPANGLEVLNRDAFGGDLLAWSALEPDSTRATTGPATRWTVDAAMPGARVLERVLAKGNPGSSARAVRLVYLDVGVSGRDSIHSGWRTPGVTPLFAVRCPVLATPAAQALVRGLGAGAFANLVRCAAGTP